MKKERNKKSSDKLNFRNKNLAALTYFLNKFAFLKKNSINNANKICIYITERVCFFSDYIFTCSVL